MTKRSAINRSTNVLALPVSWGSEAGRLAALAGPLSRWERPRFFPAARPAEIAMNQFESSPTGQAASRICEVEMTALEAQLAAALVLMTAHERSGQAVEQRLALARKIGTQLQALSAEMRLSPAFRRIVECLGSQWAEEAGMQAAAQRGRLACMPAAPGMH
ncbi:MAG: hypothetical protein ACOZD0_04690 [Pseudomonadota bacterium]